MKDGKLEGISFGLTSGVITTLGIIISLFYIAESKKIIITGILTIAIADAFSDSLGMHIAKESQKKSKEGGIWRTTRYTFFSKLIIGLTFLIPIIFLKTSLGVITAIIWGISLLTILSYKIARIKKTNIKNSIFEHLLIALIVIFISFIIGRII